MSLLSIVLLLVVAGVALYLINKYIPMDPKIKTVLNWTVVIIIVIWLLKGLHIFDGMKSITV